MRQHTGSSFPLSHSLSRDGKNIEGFLFRNSKRKQSSFFTGGHNVGVGGSEIKAYPHTALTGLFAWAREELGS